MDTTEYESLIDSQVEELHDIAEEAREKRDDPTPHVESDIANDIAERCEKLIGVTGLQDLIIELNEEGYGREEMAFEIAEALAEGEIGDYDSADQKIEAAIRTAVALLTEGVVAAPIDGIGEIKVEENDDGTEFIRVPYFGPIRSAGGTGQALSVLVADHIRQELGISEFKPREDEIHRYVEEMQLYESTTGLQYTPKEKEVKHIIENCPIMVDGVQTEDKEVGGYRDLERIDGNRPRGGMCLVVGEGIAQKAPKIQRYVESVGIDGWDWIDEIVEGTIGKHDSDEESEESEGEETDAEENEDGEVEADGGVDEELIENTELARFQGNSFEPSKKFKADALGGRPIFGDASHKGSFRLRYGRARNTGLAASGFNPATMVIVDKFIATGTQLKTERPGKAQGAVPVTSIEGPTVKLYDGTVKQVHTESEAEEVLDKIDEIIDLGEILITHGEFLENNHDLAPAPWTSDWWHREYLHAGGDPEEWSQYDVPTIDESIQLSHQYDIPLHPEYTFYWSEIEPSDYERLSTEIANTEQSSEGDTVTVTLGSEVISIIESLCIEHTQIDENTIELNVNDYRALTLVCDTNNEYSASDFENTLDYINEVAPVEIRKRVTLRIGARMGRPEKAEFREMDNKKINGLFPVDEAGRHKDVISAAEDDTGANQNFSKKSSDYQGKGIIETSLPTRECPDCEIETWEVRCPDCNTRTEEILSCYNCGLDGHEHGLDRSDECPDPKCSGKIIAYERQEFNINEQLDKALDSLDNTRKAQLDTVKAVEGLSSATKIVEPLEKGLLRAKHDIGTFRDGTSRFDMVDLPLTHFKPEEIGLAVEKAKELGYTEDIHGNELEDGSQVLELQKQDMIIAEHGAEYMLQVANYVDELLDDYYSMEPYYNAETIEDLHGHLVAGLAPHTSAAVVGRIIGHTNIRGHYAHPVYHAAKRRNCFAYDEEVTVFDSQDDQAEIPIGEFVESHFEGAEVVDAYGTEVATVEEDFTVRAIDSDGQVHTQSVEKVQRSPAPEFLVEVTLDNGNSVKMTKDHKVIVPDGDGTAEVPSVELEEGDTVYANQAENKSETYQVSETTTVQYDGEYVYCLEVSQVHNFGLSGSLQASNCDGDEDSIMLLLDGFLNFSQQYLPDKRGRRSMDAPLLMTSIVDPEEIDDEAHNVTTQSYFPLEFYYKSQEKPGPKEMDIPIIEDRLEGDLRGIGFTTKTDDVGAGPLASRYNELEGMDAFVDHQLELAARSRSVDESMVASKVIDKHFMPDILGCLNAFTKQEFMCNMCYEKFQFPPFNHECPNCGGSCRGTMAKGNVTKYIDTATEVAEKYNVSDYMKQRLEVLEDRMDQLLEDETNKQAGLGDFM